jgi:hypothetical protein
MSVIPRGIKIRKTKRKLLTKGGFNSEICRISSGLNAAFILQPLHYVS